MNFINVGYDKAHAFVSANKNLFWNGWEIVETRKDADAIFNKHGIFRNGSWHKVVRRTTLGSDGTWKVPTKYDMAR
jgi:hypothetical protein